MTQGPVARLKTRTWEILDGTNTKWGLPLAANVFVLVLIFLNVIAVLLETVGSIKAAYGPQLQTFELISVVVFTLEYLLRLWSCTVDEDYEGGIRGRLSWIFSPMALIDLAAILPFFLPFLFAIDARFLRVLRLFRLFRLMKASQYSKYARAFSLLVRVARAKRRELIVTLFVAGVCLIFASGLVYHFEREAQPDKFSSIPAAFWWGVATLSTVGYGDVFPVTLGGKIVGAFTALIGVGLFAAPAAIIADGLRSGLEAATPDTRSHAGPSAPPASAPLTCPNCGCGLALAVAT